MRWLAAGVLTLLLAGVLFVGPGGDQVPHLGFAPRPHRGEALPAPTVIDNQIDPSMIPEAPIRAAVEAQGLTYVFGGRAACGPGLSPPGVDVVCVAPSPCRCWSFWYFAGGITLSPMLIGRSPALAQEAVCHEIANARGLPESPPSTRDCTAMAMNGSIDPPRGRG